MPTYRSRRTGIDLRTIFHVDEDEPVPICGNCDSYVDDLNGEGHCMNSQSEKYQLCPDPADGCKKFFPDPKRWPDADHGDD